MSLVVRAKIGGGDVRRGEHLTGWPVGDDRALVEDDDAARQAGERAE